MRRGIRARLSPPRGDAPGAPPAPESETPPPPDPPWAPALRRLVDEVRHTRRLSDRSPLSIRSFPSGAALLALPPELQTEVAVALLDLLGHPMDQARFFRTSKGDFRQLAVAEAHQRNVLRALLKELLRRRLPWSDARLAELLDAAAVQSRRSWKFSLPGVIQAVEAYVEREGLSRPLDEALERFGAAIEVDSYRTAERRPLRDRVATLRSCGGTGGRTEALSRLLRGRDAWSGGPREALATMDEGSRQSWGAMLETCATARASKPGKAWLAEAAERLAPIGAEAFTGVLAKCLSSVGMPGDPPGRGRRGVADTTLLDERSSDLLRGLVWAATLASRPDTVAALGRAAEMAFQKVADHGPRSPAIGNACLLALSRVATPAAVAELSRLGARVKHLSSRKQVETALSAAAQQLGMTADDLEEQATPALGFQEVGRKRQAIDGYQARIETDGSRVELTVRTPSGGEQRSVPAALRTAHPDEVSALRRSVVEVRGVLSTLRARLEALYLRDRGWGAAAWRARYADHPLMGALARRLIWRLSTVSGEDERLVAWQGGAWVDLRADAVEIGAGLQVRLWHPIESPVPTIQVWRRFLEEQGICQPFKQAHREIYLLTDAERETRLYSNRFAAHILRQHQLAALARERGWQYSLQGVFDSSEELSRALPRFQLRALYTVPRMEEEEALASGIYPHVGTDRMRFVDHGGAPVPLDSIPPIVFSEVLRDVDLFVGVASIGADPDWVERPDAPFNTYWRGAALGEIGIAGETRREVLERLLPRLAIANRCRIAGRFLHVQGNLWSYNIHLGSGSVLRAPDDRFLCIVRGRPSITEAELPALPFEGDAMLSLILSKALLLAADDQIVDPIILRQLRP